MRVMLDKNVVDTTYERIRYLFNEFENVVVSISGGKDSDVIYNIALNVAREMNRLPLKVFYLDQEMEWDHTIEHIRKIMNNPEVEPLWFQIPFSIFNAASFKSHWLKCWDDNDVSGWMRPKETLSYKKNLYGTERFAELFTNIPDVLFKDQRTAFISGVRTEESPRRFMGLTQMATYKWITWGKKLKGEQFTFYPIYDWTYKDIWKYIYENDIEYNKIYDYFYRYGVPINNMRVSNLNHETAVRSLFILQEIEPETYVKATKRLDGVDAAGKMGWDDFYIKELPFMFKDWKEYRDYLLDNIVNEDYHDIFQKKFNAHDLKFGDLDEMFKVHINSMITNDWEFIKIKSWETQGTPFKMMERQKNKSNPDFKNIKISKKK